MTDAELKDCPFCDSDDIQAGGDDKVVGYWCNNCQAQGPNEYGNYTWNDRAPSPAAVMVDREAIMELIRANISTFDDVGVEESADAILSALTPAPVAGWRPMESAPKDGEAVDLWVETDSGGQRFANMVYLEGETSHANDWVDADDMYSLVGDGLATIDQVTAWMPLPPAPTEHPTEQPSVSAGAVDALAAYQQADQDGIMVLVSRQAIEECLPALRSLAQEGE